jgi:DNA-binding FadR family transcriptional regulator
LAWPCHRYINFLARSPRLVNTIGTLQRAVPRVFPMSISDEMDSTKVRYREILTAMQGRDPALAESLVRDLAMDLAQWLMALLDGDSSFPSVDPFQARQNAY